MTYVGDESCDTIVVPYLVKCLPGLYEIFKANRSNFWYLGRKINVEGKIVHIVVSSKINLVKQQIAESLCCRKKAELAVYAATFKFTG